MDDDDLESFALKIRVSPRMSRPARTASVQETKATGPPKEKAVPQPQSVHSVYANARYHKGYRSEAEQPYTSQNFDALSDVPVPPQAKRPLVVACENNFRMQLRDVEIDEECVGVVDDERDLGVLDEMLENARKEADVFDDALDAVPAVLRKSLRSIADIEDKETMFRAMEVKRSELEDLAQFSAIVDSDISICVSALNARMGT